MDKVKILVVDDESRMRKLVRDFLTRQNYEAYLTCETAQQMEQSDQTTAEELRQAADLLENLLEF